MVYRHRQSDRPGSGTCRLLAASIFCGATLGCTAGTERLDEAVFHAGPEFRLKLVRYRDNLPLHFQGEVARVQCASSGTAGTKPHKTQDAGWVALGYGSRDGSSLTAAQWAERERANYRVFGPRVLAWIGSGVSVSFDACATFASWYPTALPADWIIPVPRPEHCAPRGKADCRYLDFEGDRAPRFDDLQVSTAGEIAFTVRTRALKQAQSVRVRSADFGRTWHAETR